MDLNGRGDEKKTCEGMRDSAIAVKKFSVPGHSSKIVEYGVFGGD